MKKAASIDEYLQDFSGSTLQKLQAVRKAIKSAAPSAEEAISYGIPTFKLNGNLVHFAGYKAHIGFYPAPSGIEAFDKELEPYKAGRGTLRFELDQPLPLDLIKQVVAFRVEQNMQKANEPKTAVKKVAATSQTDSGFLHQVSSPARKALQLKGISTLKQLAKYSEKELLSLHGLGPSAIPVLSNALEQAKLAFKKD